MEITASRYYEKHRWFSEVSDVKTSTWLFFHKLFITSSLRLLLLSCCCVPRFWFLYQTKHFNRCCIFSGSSLSLHVLRLTVCDRLLHSELLQHMWLHVVARDLGIYKTWKDIRLEERNKERKKITKKRNKQKEEWETEEKYKKYVEESISNWKKGIYNGYRGKNRLHV